MQSIEQYSFLENRFYDRESSQRPSASGREHENFKTSFFGLIKLENFDNF